MKTETKIKFQNEILETQKQTEDQLKEFITDRTTIDILAYTLDIQEVNYKNWINEHCVGRYDILFYLPIEFPIQNDGVRNTDEQYRELIAKRIRRILQELDLYDKHVQMYTLT